jgi:putative membrane protein
MMGWHGYAGLDWTTGLFVIVLAGILVWTLRGSLSERLGSRHTRSRSHSALDIAQERYARGEISRDEFLEITNDLYLTNSNYQQKRKRSEQ